MVRAGGQLPHAPHHVIHGLEIKVQQASIKGQEKSRRVERAKEHQEGSERVKEGQGGSQKGHGMAQR